MALSSGKGALADINVTPLIDVLLVLLIIFMVTTAAAEHKRTEKLKEESLDEIARKELADTESLVAINLPVTPENTLLADPETTKLIMVVDRELRVYLARGLKAENTGGPAAQVTLADCSAFVGATDDAAWARCLQDTSAGFERLRGNVRLRNGLYLEGDTDVPYGFMATLMARLRDFGVEKVDIVTNPNNLPAP